MRRCKHILLISDIEGSSGCWDRQAARFLTPQWKDACVAMSRDADAVAGALFDAGVESVHVRDFHRTGYNLLPGLIDRRARVQQGYAAGPVPGIGRVEGMDAVMFIGMHAASGTPGFLAHTLTARIAELKLNGRTLSEFGLLCAVLAPFGLAPLLFSGCPVACGQAREAAPGIQTHAIDKSGGPTDFSGSSWRKSLAAATAAALKHPPAECAGAVGPFDVEIIMHDKAEAAAAARRWGCTLDGARIRFARSRISEVYMTLIRICYLGRTTARFMRTSLFLYRLLGRAGWLTVWWAHRRKSRTSGI